MLIQRLGNATLTEEGFVDTFIQKMKENKGSCDEVWLSSEYGYPPMPKHQSMADFLVTVKDRFEKAGIRVSMQIANTVGHGEYMSSKDNSGLVYSGSPAEHLVGHDGKKATYCFCWNGENFRKYMLEQMRVYADVKPRVLWFDDDLRPENHNPVLFGCFCDNCIDKFNGLCGTSYTREELVKEINYGDVEVRGKWIEFHRQSIAEFTYLLAKEFVTYSPDTTMAYQYGYYGNYSGQDSAHIFDALYKACGKPPMARPGGGVYNDHDPNLFFQKMLLIEWNRYLLPDYVEDMLPEVENLPDVKFGKSIAGCTFESTLYFAAGSTGMTYAMAMNTNEDLDWHGEMLASFAKQSPYWKKLSDVNRVTKPVGLSIYVPKETWRYEIDEGKPPFAWTFDPVNADSKWIPAERNAYEEPHPGSDWLTLGIPLCYGDKEIYLLPASCAKRLTNEEIQQLLTKPVVTDGEALEYLASRGYSFSAKAEACLTQKCYEAYADHTVNEGIAKRNWSQSFYFTHGHKLTDITGETEVVSYYESDALDVERGEGKYPFGIANAVVRTDSGAKWMVFGYVPWTSVVSSGKRMQMINAINYISDYKLKAYVDTPIRSVVLPRADKGGRLVSVSVINGTIGESGELDVRLTNPVGESFSFVSQTSEEIPLTWTKDGSTYRVKLPSLAPWTVGTIFIN